MEITRGKLLEGRERRWSGGFNALDPAVLELAEADRREGRRAWRLAIAAGIVVHVALFVITFPQLSQRVYRIGGGGQMKVYRLQQVKFTAPPPRRQVQRAPAKPKAKRIPIPDPTPNDPEPVYQEDAADIGESDFPEADVSSSLGIPNAPPGVGNGPFQVSGNIRAPERIFAPDPVYPEEARQARVQGVVILQTIIDTVGSVTDVRVLKGLPSGLTEAAVAAVSQWKFHPATLNGKPVAVYYLVTVTFSVQ